MSLVDISSKNITMNVMMLSISSEVEKEVINSFHNGERVVSSHRASNCYFPFRFIGLTIAHTSCQNLTYYILGLNFDGLHATEL